MSESTFRAAQIRVPIIHPIELGRHAVTFDGLLWSALDAHHCDPDKAKERLGDYLTFTEGVAHASMLRFGIKPSRRLIAAKRKTVGVMRQESDLTHDQFHPTGSKGKYSQVNVSGGPYKNRVNDHELYHAPFALFYIHGDAPAIVELLNFYIHCVGVNAASGSGTVGVWQYAYIDNDRSLVDADGLAARAVPIEIFRTRSSQIVEAVDIATAPPYHTSTKQPCAMPERVVRELIQ